jgi:acyl-CoA-binding protein
MEPSQQNAQANSSLALFFTWENLKTTTTTKTKKKYISLSDLQIRERQE